MKQSITYFIALLASFGLNAQTTATFEDLNLPVDTFLNGSDGSGGFSNGNVFLPNTFTVTPDFSFWSGWSISSMTDTLTPGPSNQYSAIAGSGYDGSSTYAITYAAPGTILRLSGDAVGHGLSGFYVTNNTYAYFSMLNGDTFAKKFGGETGDDPDFLLLTIKKYFNGSLGTDSIDFYMADYRFADHSQDYIVKDWNFIDLSSLGNADSLLLSISGSDSSPQFGLNTPAYVCVDNITTLDQTTAIRDYNPNLAIRVFPNPTVDQITLSWEEDKKAIVSLFSTDGRSLRQQALVHGNNEINMRNLPAGNYFLRVETEDGWLSRVLVKH